MSSPIKIYLSDRAPKTILEEEWPILISTPASNKAQDLIVRVESAPPTGFRRAVVYGQVGAGLAELPGAGLYSGLVVSTSAGPAGFLDQIAAALFSVGSDIGMDVKQVWPLVQSLEAHAL